MPPLAESNSSRRHSLPTAQQPMDTADGGGGIRKKTSSNDLPLVRCVLVGDGAVGKTSLLSSYSKSECPSEYIPTAFDNYAVVVQVDGRPIQLQLCDTAGQDELDSLRSLCYSNSDVFLVCFSITCYTSFHNITAKWLPEIRQHCPRNVPIILVGTKSDLRTNKTRIAELEKYKEQPISEDMAKQTAADIQSAMYIECSALTNQNVKDVFDAAIFAALDQQGFIRKCRGFSSIRGSKKYKCKSKLWEIPHGITENVAVEKKHKKRLKFLSCFSV